MPASILDTILVDVVNQAQAQAQAHVQTTHTHVRNFSIIESSSS